MTASNNQGRLPSPAQLLVMVALALIGGASAGLGGLAFVPIGVIIGGVWGWGLSLIAGRIRSHERANTVLGGIALFLTAFCAIMVAGASLMGQLLSSAAMDAQPRFFADMIRGPIGFAEALPFYTLNTAIEWLLLPMALLLSPKQSRARGLIVAALVVWTCHRTWTYVYFVPRIMLWSHGTAPFTPAELTQVRAWIDLSWLRQMCDDVVGACLLASVFLRARAPAQGQ